MMMETPTIRTIPVSNWMPIGSLFPLAGSFPAMGLVIPAGWGRVQVRTTMTTAPRGAGKVGRGGWGLGGRQRRKPVDRDTEPQRGWPDLGQWRRRLREFETCRRWSWRADLPGCRHLELQRERSDLRRGAHAECA